MRRSARRASGGGLWGGVEGRPAPTMNVGGGWKSVAGRWDRGGGDLTPLFLPGRKREKGQPLGGSDEGVAEAGDDGAPARPEIEGVGTKRKRGGRGVHVF